MVGFAKFMGMAAVLSLWRNKRELPVWVFFRNSRNVFKKDELGVEIAQIAIPSALALTADPIASLIDTAFIGRIGPVELAAVGVSIAVFNQVSKVAIFPLVSITTSFVAEEDTVEGWNDDAQVAGKPDTNYAKDSEMEELIPLDSKSNPSSSASSGDKLAKSEHGRRHLPAASTAMIIGALLGLMQALFLICAAKPILNYMGISSDSPMLTPARQYLTLRSLGAPAVLLSLAMQGVFRGFKDTKTPLYATVAGDAANIVLDPILMFGFSMGVNGAAIAHVFSQYIICLILMWRLMKEVNLLPPHMRDLQFGRFLGNGFLLLLRVMAVTFCVTLAASLAARQGSTPMAAFQICLQIWLATSLLADGLAVAGQAIIASAFARKDYDKATTTASRVLQLGLALGILLALVLVAVLSFASRIFTEDINVLQLISLGTPFVAVTQPINALAFVFDGINYGASDFMYAAYSMVLVAVVSILCLLLLSSLKGFVGIWIALSIYMSFRALAGFWRIGTGRGPWRFLRS
ncbi:Protein DETOXIFICATION 42, variant 2 [Ancistrocladus abbreviatus]